jgi:hypothetical protein
MEGVVIPYRTMALLNRRRSNFDAMSHDSCPPGLGCMLSFFIEFERAATEEMPGRAADITLVCNSWATKGIAAAESNAGTEINWASPCIMDQLFQELGNAIGVN